MVVLVVAALAWAGAPPVVQPTEVEAAKLARGEVVIRPPPNAKSEVVGMVDIPATHDQVWSVVLDFDARVEAVRVLRDAEIYRPEGHPDGLGVSFVLSVLGTEIVYHLAYEVDREGGWCTYALDPEREHGIAMARGSYQITPIQGGHRLTYRAMTDTGRPVPGFIQKMLATGQLKDQLEVMKVNAPNR